MNTTNLVGQIIGDYKVVQKIGVGTIATVYKAYQSKLGRWVALKILNDIQQEGEIIHRFRREAKVIANLYHPNIITMYEYNETHGLLYIVMEYIEKGSLETYLAQQSLDWGKAVKLAIAIAKGLKYAHHRKIIHRDVKPSNVLLSDDEWPLLTDFGLAKVINANDNKTGKGVSVGTPHYVAPEQARGDTIDFRVDIYSLGVVLYQMVTGQVPFNHFDINQVLLAHMLEPLPSPRELNPDCPPSLEVVIYKATQKQPTNRYGSMAEMIKTLQDVLSLSRQSTAPFEQPFDDWDDDVANRTADLSPLVNQSNTDNTELTVQLFLVEQGVTLDVPVQDSLILGRQTPKNPYVDVDFTPYGGGNVGVSRQHARLIKREEAWLIEDLNSFNGTYLNRKRLPTKQPTPIKNGDLVHCSHFPFMFLVSNIDEQE